MPHMGCRRSHSMKGSRQSVMEPRSKIAKQLLTYVGNWSIIVKPWLHILFVPLTAMSVYVRNVIPVRRCCIIDTIYAPHHCKTSLTLHAVPCVSPLVPLGYWWSKHGSYWQPCLYRGSLTSRLTCPTCRVTSGQLPWPAVAGNRFVRMLQWNFRFTCFRVCA